MSELTLKVIRKNYTQHNKSLWRTLVQESSDGTLLSLLEKCWETELEYIAYYAVIENRHEFLRLWWQSSGKPQIKSESDITNVVLGLNMVRNFANPVPILLTIIKWSALRALYPGHLILGRGAGSTLMRVLMYLCSRIPNGTSLLVQEWKSHHYDHSIWNTPLFIKLSVNKEDDTVYINHSTHVYAVHIIDHVCRFGSPKDLKFALRNTDWWVAHHLVDLASNRNDSTFKYFIEYLWTIKKVCEQFSSLNLDKKIWGFMWINEVLDAMVVSEMLDVFHDLRSWRRRIRALNWVLPELCTPKSVTNSFGLSRIFNQFDRRFMFMRYTHFSAQFPVHYTAEQLIAIEKYRPILVPNIVGKTVKKPLPDNLFPQLYQFPQTIWKLVEIGDKKVHVVIDVDFPGNWVQRLEKMRQLHRFASVDFQTFLQSTKERNVWWVAPTLSKLTTSDFFAQLESRPALGGLPVNGWLVAGENGLFLKVKHEAHLYAEKYDANTWSFPLICETEMPDIQVTAAQAELEIDKMLAHIAPTRIDIHYNSNKIEAVFRLACRFYPNLSLECKDRLKEYLLNCKCGCVQYIYNSFNWILKGAQPNAYTRNLVWRCKWDPTIQEWRPTEYAFHKCKPSEHCKFTLLTARYMFPVKYTELCKWVSSPKSLQPRVKFSTEDYFLITDMQKSFPATISFGGQEPVSRSVSTVITDNPDIAGGLSDDLYTFIWTDCAVMCNPITRQPLLFNSAPTILECIRWVHHIIQRGGLQAFLQAIKSFKFAIFVFDDVDLGASSAEAVSYTALRDAFSAEKWIVNKNIRSNQLRVCVFSKI